MQVLKHGAEARLYRTTYLGMQAVVKQRQRKKYREKKLDDRIIRERMRAECGFLARAKKAGVRVPVVWKVSLGECSITEEFIGGKTLKEELLMGNPDAGNLCEEAGKTIARLHSHNLVHGDITTSNIILHNGALVFLDFGLGKSSSKKEDLAVDLLVFKKTFLATHYRIKNHWETIENAYAKAFGGGKSVLSHLKTVEARARYF